MSSQHGSSILQLPQATANTHSTWLVGLLQGWGPGKVPRWSAYPQHRRNNAAPIALPLQHCSQGHGDAVLSGQCNYPRQIGWSGRDHRTRAHSSPMRTIAYARYRMTAVGPPWKLCNGTKLLSVQAQMIHLRDWASGRAQQRPCCLC